MAVTSFAAICIGSYEVTLDVFEISRKNGIHCIDKIRHRIELGRQPFANSGRISPEMVDEVCRVLRDFLKIVRMYRVSQVRAIATSAVREASNDLFVLGKIRQMTGLEVQTLSNAEQRFLSYKAIASMEGRFSDMIRKGTAIVDLDGGSFQLSVFDKSQLITTQNMRQGSLRVREKLQALEAQTTEYETLVEELIRADTASFRKMYLRVRKIENVILNGGLISEIIFRDQKHRDRSTRIMDRAAFEDWYGQIAGKSENELASSSNISLESASLFRPTAVICHWMVSMLDANMIWMPGTDLSRGLAYEFAEKNKLLKMSHNFGSDIITAARHMARRYAVSKAHIDNVDMMATAIFDAMAGIHGMGSRDRLLLRITAMLLDVGKYISYANIGENTCQIIMSNEFIGLSHMERELIAQAARYTLDPLPEYEDFVLETSLDEQGYLKTASLAAILRLANVMDRTRMQKVVSLRAELKEHKLMLHAAVRRNYVLEQGLMREAADFFSDVFGVQPVLKIRKNAGGEKQA